LQNLAMSARMIMAASWQVIVVLMVVVVLSVDHY
jgi:hypothetical protein